MTPAQSPPHIATLIVLTGVSVLTLNMALPSLVNIARDFQADYALISLAVAGYLAITAVLQLIIGPLSDIYGRRPLLLICLALFALASLGCFLAQNVWVFLGFRLLQGAVIAASALPRVIVRDTRPPTEAVSLLGYIGMAMAVAPMLGPMVGGLLDEAFGWRASFALLAVTGAALWLLAWRDLGETYPGTATGMLSTFSGYAVLMRSGIFLGYSGCMALSIGAFFCFVTGAPLVAETAFGLGPGMVGLIVGSITGGFFCGSFLSGRYSNRFAIDTTMIAGRVLATAGLSVGIALALAGVDHPFALFGTTVFVGIGNGISTPSSTMGTMSVRDDLAGTASGLAGAMTVGAGAVLTWATGIIIGAAPTPLNLLAIMFAATFGGLLCAVLTARANRSVRAV